MGVAVVAGELERVGRLGAVVADATDERRVVEGERNPDDATVMISVTDDRTDDDERRWRRRAALLRRRELLSPVEVVDAVSSASPCRSDASCFDVDDEAEEEPRPPRLLDRSAALRHSMPRFALDCVAGSTRKTTAALFSTSSALADAPSSSSPSS